MPVDPGEPSLEGMLPFFADESRTAPLQWDVGTSPLATSAVAYQRALLAREFIVDSVLDCAVLRAVDSGSGEPTCVPFIQVMFLGGLLLPR